MVVATKQTVSNASSQVPLWIRTWTLVSSLVVIWVIGKSVMDMDAVVIDLFIYTYWMMLGFWILFA